MRIIELVGGANMIQLARLEANRFTHAEKRDYIGHNFQNFGLIVEVWVKPDGQIFSTYEDFGNLEELEDK